MFKMKSGYKDFWIELELSYKLVVFVFWLYMACMLNG